MKILRFLILGLGLSAAACATAPIAWDKPGASREEWERDQWDCRAKARREAEKHLRQQGPSFRSSGLNGTTLDRDMSRHDARRDEQRMFEQCLKLRGYVPKTWKK
ncbi:MAG: hypothetical protein ISR51_05275 [Rhodospirillales bacterium]|nr:hypothetical protein [Alphaproteobacteria bacterium]MBL6948070.1 hypothetical protein [Rhodospirillales bacterium]